MSALYICDPSICSSAEKEERGRRNRGMDEWEERKRRKEGGREASGVVGFMDGGMDGGGEAG